MHSSMRGFSAATLQNGRAHSVGKQQQLVTFTGFRKSGMLDNLGARGSPHSLQSAVRKAITSSNGRKGAKCLRVTRMMFERFTEKAIKVVMLAQEEARRLGHNFVGTEQILLGLVGESTGTSYTR